MTQLLALSIRQPWAHAIVHLGKDVENRKSRFGRRGWTLLHASAGMTDAEYDSAIAFMHERGVLRLSMVGRDQQQRGGIVGITRIVDSVSADPGSPWWMGPCGLVLADTHVLPFTPCKGTVAPLFWTPDAETMARLRPAILALGIPELAA